MADTSNEINFSRFGDAMRREILKEILAIAKQIQGSYAVNAPQATGHLSGSFANGLDMVETELGVAVQVGTPYQYGQYVEFGTKPHFINKEGFEALVRWVDEKQLDRVDRFIKHGFTTRASRKVKEGRKFSPRESKIRSIAYAIKLKIAKRGTPQQKFMDKSLKQLGLEYVLEDINGDMIYSIDLEKFLAPRMQQLTERAAVGNA